MKTRYTVALSILAGVAVGAAAVQALHAQAKPPAYVVAEIDVTNAEPYDKEYVPPAAKADHGRWRQICCSRRQDRCDFRSATPTAHRCDGLREHGKGKCRI